MSQGFAKRTTLLNIAAGDSPSIDAFGRWRVSAPTYVFDSQQTYNLNPLLWEQIVLNAGATITHDATNRCALMTFAATATGGKAFMQTYECFRYQPGRSQAAFITFNFIETKANCLKFAGYSDGVNGVELQQDGTTVQAVLYTGTSHGTETVAQSSWNLDKLDGTGTSGITLDLTKVQILVIDMQALYVGRVRIGFDIGGTVIYVHQFLHANIDTFPYIQSANLPLRVGMTCTGTVSTTMRFVCCSVLSGGGQLLEAARDFTAEGSVTAASGARTHILSVRPRTTFNSITNRIKLVLGSVDLLVTGNAPILWELAIGQAITGSSYASVNANHSGFEASSAGTLSGSPEVVIAAGYVASSVQSKGDLSQEFETRYPITLDSAGVVRANGTLTLMVTGIGNTSACRASLNWREVR